MIAKLLNSVETYYFNCLLCSYEIPLSVNNIRRDCCCKIILNNTVLHINYP